MHQSGALFLAVHSTLAAWVDTGALQRGPVGAYRARCTAPHRTAPPLAKQDDRYSVLERRIAALGSEEAEVQCILLDCMVPRQRFEQNFPPPVGDMLRRVREEGKILCVLGMSHSFDPSGRPVFGSVLRHGVEARIESMLSVPMGDSTSSPSFFSSHTAQMGVGAGGGGERIQCSYVTTLVGGRRFELLQAPTALQRGRPPEQPIWPATVRWLPDEDAQQTPSAAIALAETLPPLVKEWVEVVLFADLERVPGQARPTSARDHRRHDHPLQQPPVASQVKQLYADLGPMPEPEDAEGLAFWVAALICPLPGLKLSPELELRLECRPAVLAATSSLERVKAAHGGIVRALKTLRAL